MDVYTVLADYCYVRHTYNRPINIASDTRKRDGRRHGRLRTERLSCNIGMIVDISASGFRVRSKRYPGVKIGQNCQLTLRVEDHRLSVRVTTLWIRRLGYRHFEAGLEFIDMTPEAIQELHELARSASVWSIQPLRVNG